MSKEFPISICMAGAVSAGAYSAGVMAELLHTIRIWSSNEESLPFAPAHTVKIKGFSGASAGSIQAVLSTLDMLASSETQELGKQAWFSATLDKLLNTDDLTDAEQENRVLKSVLNSDALRGIANDALGKHDWATRWPDFLAQPLKVRLSITNLRGVPFNVSLPNGNTTDFGMSIHNEYVRYEIAEQVSASPAHHSIEFGSDAMQQFADGALASSAFPLAFAPIKLDRSSQGDDNYFTTKDWMNAARARSTDDAVQVDYTPDKRAPDWNTDYPPANTVYAVDGGATNNEPLIEAFKVLFGDGLNDWRVPDENSWGKVLMIDPFPNAVDRKIEESSIRLDKVLGMLVNALMAHARFSEPLMVSKNLQNRVGLIYPSLPDREGNLLALKSGALGGFAGFLKPAFMQHDYALGRLNMRRFLRYHFTLPAEHDLFSDWQGKEHWIVQKDGVPALPILPVYDKNAAGEWQIFNVDEQQKTQYYRDGLEDFTQLYTKDDKSELAKQLKKRFLKVGLALLSKHEDFDNEDQQVEQDKRGLFKKAGDWFLGKVRGSGKWLGNGAIKSGWRLFGAGYLAKAVMRTIEDALQEQGMLDYKVKRRDTDH